MNGLITFLVVALASTSFAAKSCPAVSDPAVTVLLPHESDCGKFYYCVHGKQVENDCPAGLHFSVKANQCEWPEIAECDVPSLPCQEIPKPEPATCPAEADPNVTVLLPHESDCSKFYYCVHGNQVLYDCPAGLHFGVKANRCEWPEIAECDAPTTECPPEPTPAPASCPAEADPNVTILLPHESDCSKFYYCVHGNQVPFDCPGGLHFSVKANQCEWPAEAGCQ